MATYEVLRESFDEILVLYLNYYLDVLKNISYTNCEVISGTTIILDSWKFQFVVSYLVAARIPIGFS